MPVALFPPGGITVFLHSLKPNSSLKTFPMPTKSQQDNRTTGLPPERCTCAFFFPLMGTASKARWHLTLNSSAKLMQCWGIDVSADGIPPLPAIRCPAQAVGWAKATQVYNAGRLSLVSFEPEGVCWPVGLLSEPCLQFPGS